MLSSNPYAPPRMPTFEETVGISANYDWNQLEYTEMCNSDVVKALVGPMAGELSTIGFLSAPYASFLRLAEGIDSIRNLGVMTVGSNHTEHDRAAAIVCGFAQFGGVLWIAVLLVVLGGAFSVSLPCALCCLRCAVASAGCSKGGGTPEGSRSALAKRHQQGRIEPTEA